jgi:hypothetical protein
MESLRELQTWLATIILAPSKLETAEGATEALARTRARDRDTAVVRLGVYSGGYPARIGDALAESFAAVAHVVGRERFRQLTRQYLPHVPDGIYNLSDVGAEFPAFLALHDEVSVTLPFLHDLARLEWAVQRAFHARENTPFDPAPLSSWGLDAWERAVLELQPSVAVVRSAWPIREIWESRTRPVDEIDIAIEDRPQCVLVHRVGFKVACEAVDEAQAVALEALTAGRTLGETAELLADAGHDAERVGAWFSEWNRRGLVVACVSPGTS